MSASNAYSAEKTTDHGVDVVRLTDPSGVEVLIAPSLGNRAYTMNVRGSNILYMPAENVSQLNKLSGIPFLAPWANRIPGLSFYANGKRYLLNEGLGVLRMHPGQIAIHGMLCQSPLWKVTDVSAGGSSARVTSRVEFWRYPDLMANWPFAHEYEMTYRLQDGTLEVSTTVTNLSAAHMPISVGFHPYFMIPGVPRSTCMARIPARKRVAVDSHFVATGEMEPYAGGDPLPLAGARLDDGFTDLIRDPDGYATFWIDGGGKRVEASFGPKYQVGIVWSPPDQEFICFEPMAAVTNAVNLAHEGLYPDLQTVAPGESWAEKFRVRGTGF